MSGLGLNSTPIGNIDLPNGTNYDEDLVNSTIDELIYTSSDLGGRSNPLGSTASSLFYQGAKGLKTPDQKKYGKYLFYGIGQDRQSSNTLDATYYLSESRAFNKNISSLASKNPTAKQLVTLSDPGGKSDDRYTSIVGGSKAPYNWSDFLYCKYYGRIPNNYMVTLRRYPTPMLDNLSLPTAITYSDLHKYEGAGKPVAQAVTWFGGNTGNTLNDIISFSTGMRWDPKYQSEILNQKGMDTGFTKSILGLLAGGTEQATMGDDSFSTALRAMVGTVMGSTIEGESNITDRKVQFGLREKGTETDGPLSDFIFTSVDTVDKTFIRGRGLKFDAAEINLEFDYELTSVGQVNTKAAFLDLFTNILSIGTNYGTFLRPDYRYNNEFPAIGFPGGDAGLKAFYASPVSFIMNYYNGLTEEEKDAAAVTMADKFPEGSDTTQTAGDYINLKTAADLQSIIDNVDLADEETIAIGDRALKAVLSDSFLENVTLNLSFFTGAPIGEWHLVVGNPLNPIAMIGNLICEGVKIEFGEKLGPDDFPTEFKAIFTLQHGRDREKGEIESMFNRGKGRLYQSAIKVSSNSQSIIAKANTNGTMQKYDEPEQVYHRALSTKKRQ